MPIIISDPVIIPQVDARTFNELWLSHFMVEADDPNKPVRLVGTLDLLRTLPDGTTKEKLPGGGTPFMIEDFFAEAAKDPTMLQVMGALITLIKTRAGL